MNYQTVYLIDVPEGVVIVVNGLMIIGIGADNK